MRDWLKVSADRWPERSALVCEGIEVTYGELDSSVDRAVCWLSDIGVEQGEAVGLYSRPSLETVEVIFALMRLGAVVHPINLRLSESELRYQAGFVRRVFVGRDLAWHLELPFYVIDYTKSYAVQTFERGFELDAPLSRIFTSGTSGQPKPAELTYGNFYCSAQASKTRLGASQDDCWLCCLPLYHVGGLAMLVRAVLFGMTVVLHDGFEVDRVNRSLDADGITHISLVPTMLHRLINSRTTPPPHLCICLIGGAAASDELVHKAQVAGFPIATTYGMTETTSQIATQTVEQTLKKPGSVGKAIAPFCELWIEGDNGERRTPGEIGNIVVRGDIVMRGYFGNPEATSAAFRGGAFHTGDLGYLDAEGDLWLVQRRSDLIVSGGENVYPAEVEAALKSHPAIRDACVVGIPHAEWGQQVAALIATDAPLTGDEIRQFLRQSLAGYKLPRVIKFIDELPLTASGKVERKTALRIMSGESN